MSLHGFHLNKEAGYYYLYLDRRTSDNLEHAKALTRTLSITTSEPEPEP